MGEERTTAVVQGYLDDLAGGRPAEPVIRALLEQAVRRLHELCAALLHRSYPRLTRPPARSRAGRPGRAWSSIWDKRRGERHNRDPSLRAAYEAFALRTRRRRLVFSLARTIERLLWA